MVNVDDDDCQVDFIGSTSDSRALEHLRALMQFFALLAANVHSFFFDLSRVDGIIQGTERRIEKQSERERMNNQLRMKIELMIRRDVLDHDVMHLAGQLGCYFQSLLIYHRRTTGIHPSI